MLNKSYLLKKKEELIKQLSDLQEKIDNMSDTVSIKNHSLAFNKLSVNEINSIYSYNEDIYKWFAEDTSRSIDDYIEANEPCGKIILE